MEPSCLFYCFLFACSNVTKLKYSEENQRFRSCWVLSFRSEESGYVGCFILLKATFSRSLSTLPVISAVSLKYITLCHSWLTTCVALVAGEDAPSPMTWAPTTTWGYWRSMAWRAWAEQSCARCCCRATTDFSLLWVWLHALYRGGLHSKYYG